MAKNNVLPHERVPLLKELINLSRVNLVSLDIETSLVPALVWTSGEQYVGEKNLQDRTKIIMSQYLFEGDKKPTLITWDEKHNDKRIIKHLTNNVFNKPNLIMVGQNQKSFDLKIINDAACEHNDEGIPFNSFIQVDILQLSRGSFRRSSHSLDARSKRYGFGGKLPVEFQDWVDIYYGCKKALAKMAKYGLKDPVDTLKTFWRELPYYRTLPADLEKLLRDLKYSKQTVIKAQEKEKKQKLFCQTCRKKKYKSTDIVQTHNIIHCNNCNASWRI